MSLTIADIYRYAKLSTAGYVDLTGLPNFSPASLRDRADGEGEQVARLPTSLGEQFFITDDWRVIADPRHPPTASGSHNDPSSGFAATLFQKGANGEKVLAVRGTEASDSPLGGTFLKDLEADILQIGSLGIAIAQTVSLFNLVQRMLAEPGRTDVLQLTAQCTELGDTFVFCAGVHHVLREIQLAQFLLGQVGDHFT